MIIGANMKMALAEKSLWKKAQRCNGYIELCDRKYSNITMVAAHNSPFVELANIASNQIYDVVTQLNDGIRMRSCSLPSFQV
jgi:hypothetical protein